MRRLVLASASPRRADLLASLGVSFDVIPAGIDERRHPDENPSVYVERLAGEKAAAVADPGRITIGADTVVVHEGQVLGKPRHPAEARATLERLSDDTHHVVSGVAVAVMGDTGLELESLVETALVRFAPMTTAEIADYVDTGEPLDKAGSYALQGMGGAFVESIEGHPSTVVGLPLPAVRRLLSRHGVSGLV